MGIMKKDRSWSEEAAEMLRRFWVLHREDPFDDEAKTKAFTIKSKNIQWRTPRANSQIQ